MYGQEQDDGHLFKDCFVNSEFDDNWRRFRRKISERINTLVFYPHGNLILARGYVENEIKLQTGQNGLLETILEHWQSERVVPLFVSEGTSGQKIQSIHNSYYLSTVYHEVLPMVGRRRGTLVIFGWGFGEHDLHILAKISTYRFPPRKVAVSVYDQNEAYCHQVIPILKYYFGRNIMISFFNSSSNSCWNNA